MDKQQSSYVRIPADELKRAVAGCLQAQEVAADDASVVADVLVAADLRGIESHGAARLSAYYVDALRSGGINPEPNRHLAAGAGSVFVLDADNGLGHPACHQAMNRCISLARETGIAVGGVKNSNHFGIAGYYAMQASREGMIGVCLTNSQPLVLPTYGRKPTLGTNPIAVAVPAGDYPAFVLDMATSVVPIGKIEVHQRKQKPVPASWGADADGLPSEDPEIIMQQGGLFPLGGTDKTSGYKGYGLAAVVDILSGVLTGASFLTAVSSATDCEPTGVGHFVAALRVDAMMPPDDFAKRMDQFIEQLQTAPLATDCEHIYVAGEKEYLQYEKNLQNGVPLHPKVHSELLDVCRELDVSFPEAAADES